MSVFFPYHISIVKFQAKKKKNNWGELITQVIIAIEFSFTEVMAVIQSKCKIQHSLFIQEDNKNNRMACPQKQLMLLAKWDVP